MIDISLTVNGQEHHLPVEPRWTLADVLRERLGLTGTHLGCEQGVCGACTVLVDGEPVRSCLFLGVQAADKVVLTVEGLSEPGDPQLHHLQEAFRSHHGLQCGFCTPGFLMSAMHLLRQNRDLESGEVRNELSGNLCRCTGYQPIVEAVIEAARTTAGKVIDAGA